VLGWRVHALQGLVWRSNTFLASLFSGEDIRASSEPVGFVPSLAVWRPRPAPRVRSSPFRSLRRPVRASLPSMSLGADNQYAADQHQQHAKDLEWPDRLHGRAEES
jgi:hypothetical protein